MAVERSIMFALQRAVKNQDPRQIRLNTDALEVFQRMKAEGWRDPSWDDVAAGEEKLHERKGFVDGDLRYNKGQRRVVIAGIEILLSPIQDGLLGVLTDTPGEPVSREHIFSTVWNGRFQDYHDTRTLDVHMRRLRERLATNPNAHVGQIVSVRSFGYRYAPVAELNGRG